MTSQRVLASGIQLAAAIAGFLSAGPSHAGRRLHEVQISVAVAEVTRADIEGLGIDWSTLQSAALPTVLTAPASSTRGVVLARPSVTTRSDSAATILIGGEASGKGGSDAEDFGIQLDVTPLLGKDGAIQLQIDSVTSLYGQGTAGVVQLTTRKARTSVLVPDGQTAVIGGLLQADAEQLPSRIPGLSNVPTLGRLFASRDYQQGQSDLLVFVTPSLYDEDGSSTSTGGGAVLPSGGSQASPKVPEKMPIQTLISGTFGWYGVRSEDSQDLGFPLATTAQLNFTPGSDNPATGRPFQGELPGPNTEVLNDGDGLGYGLANGFKGSVGGWFGRESRYGIEVRGFYVPESSSATSIRSGRQNSFLSVPFLDTALGSGYSVVIGSDLMGQTVSPGQIELETSLDFWGAGGGVQIRGFDPCDEVEVDLSVGFRYVQLNEELTIDYQTDRTIVPNFGDGTLGSYLFPMMLPQVGSTVRAQDYVSTENDFYGLDLGLSAKVEMLPDLYFIVAPRVALGANVQEISTSGWGDAWQPNGTMLSTPFGVFARPGGVGSRSETNFAVVPEIDLELRYEVTDWFSVYGGYNFFYVSDVVRAGNQLSNAIDAPITNTGAFQGTPTSSGGRPFETEGFYANSVRMGLQFRF